MKEAEVHHLQRFITREEGATSIEYALLAAMFALGAATAWAAFGQRVSDMFTGVSTTITGVL